MDESRTVRPEGATREILSMATNMTRKRFMELFVIAQETLTFLESKGVNIKTEGCNIRRLCEEMQNMGKE